MRTGFLFIQIVLCASLSFFGSQATAFDLVAESSLDTQTASVVQAWLLKVKGLLPPVMKSRFGDKTFTVKFSTFSGSEMAQVFPGSSQIEINKSLLIFLQKPDLQRLPVSELPAVARKIEALKKQSNDGKNISVDLPSHKNTGEFLDATLIHEISHQYDMLGVPPMEYLKTRKQCIYAAALGSRDFSPECQKIQNIKTSVSDLREFLILAGFPETGFFSGSSARTNFFTGRSPDPYEWQSPLEAFAVNMEYYLMDPNYQCRRPGLYRYISRHFGAYHPFGLKVCDNTQTVLVSAPSNDGAMTRFENFDFNKLYQVHYFFAGKGDEMMSRFGHAMLRLVFCAPYRKTVGPECLEDLTYHHVVSFRAFITDISIDSLKGLTGDYPSSLYILPLASVLTEYNATEFREISSIPLKLDRNRLKDLYDSILYSHWTYEGKYYFLSNNCATETLNLLKSVFYWQPKIFDMQVARPDSLYKLLINIGLAENIKDLVKDKEEAINRGYYFPSMRKTYEDSVKRLVEAGALAVDISLDKYLELSGNERLQLISREMSRNEIDSDKVKNLSGFLFLEDLVQTRQLQKINKEALPKVYLEKTSKQAVDANSVLGNIDLFQDYILRYSRPTTLFTSELNGRSYGVPRRAAVDAIVQSYDQTMANANFEKKLEDFSKFTIEKASYALQAQYHQTKENVKALTNQIKLLKKAKR